jgi:glycosyl transferase family 1
MPTACPPSESSTTTGWSTGRTRTSGTGCCRAAAHGSWLFVSAFTRDRALDAGWSLAPADVVPAGVDEAFRRPRPSPLGPVAHADLPYAYAAADVVIAPSLVEEPFGLVALEAMGLGRPVVATARVVAAEYLRDRANALVVEPDDPAAVSTAVRRLADDPALRARLRHGGIATAKDYTADRFHERVEAALANAVRSARR